MNQQPPFARCSSCPAEWENRDSLLQDPEIIMTGYQVNFASLEAGWFLFSHCRYGCGSTFAIKAGAFFDLYDGPIYQERKTGSEECPAYCLSQEKLDPCPALCECSFVRHIIQHIQGIKEAETVGV
jgi:hypothetical protein